MNGENTDTKRLIQRTLKLSEENNKLLRKMRRSMRWGQVFTAFYWLVIAGTAVSVYYFIQPFIESALSTLQILSSGVDELQNTGEELSSSLKPIQDVLGGNERGTSAFQSFFGRFFGGTEVSGQ